MPAMRQYLEDSYGLSSCNESALASSFHRMKETMQQVGKDPFRDAEEICRTPEYLNMLTESIQVDTSNAHMTAYQLEDAKRLNALYENVSESIMNEAVQNVSNISPIMINSFGIQERALISAHLPRAVKQVTAKIDNFKLTERIPFIVDLAGVKSKFIDAFVPDSAGTSSALTLKDKATLKFTIPTTNADLYAGNGSSGDADYRPSIGTEQVFGYDSIMKNLVISDIKEGTSFTYGVSSRRNPSVEDGSFSVVVSWTAVGEGSTETQATATVSGQFDFSNGKLLYISSTSSSITSVEFEMILSPETHTKALTIGYDTKHTPVQIPIGEHFEYNISEEFKDASDKYYNVDAMAMLTDYMGKAVEQVKDIVTLSKYQELGNSAIVNTTFNCTPTTGFAQGKEEYIRREFYPFMEKVCILLKTKVRINDCHFRVVGNPLDIRVAGAAGVEYIYKRNEQFAGEINLDYEFSVMSDIHKIFYLSSERVPVGSIYVFLIPNSIENNISTVNHYEYATYVSNKYRGTNSNLPTVMISTRYLTKEYFPVVAKVDIINNLVDTQTATPTGTGMSNSIYSKVQYVNS